MWSESRMAALYLNSDSECGKKIPCPLSQGGGEWEETRQELEHVTNSTLNKSYICKMFKHLILI